MLKRLLAMTGCMIMLSGVFVVQAGAAPPERFTETNTFTDVNPCTGQEHQVTVTTAVTIHENNRNFVVTGRTTVSTSDGYVGRGGDSFVENAGGARGNLNVQVRGPDGERFRVRGNFAFNANQDELKFDRFSLTCTSN